VTLRNISRVLALFLSCRAPSAPRADSA